MKSLMLKAVIVATILLGAFLLSDFKSANEDNDGEKILCTPESRLAEACIELYDPVCGWSDPDKIKCIKYPCASTFSNNCFACIDENVLYHTKGECPTED